MITLDAELTLWLCYSFLEAIQLYGALLTNVAGCYGIGIGWK